MVSNILKILRADWKKTFHSGITIFLLCALVILPSLYAWVNIKASWDPYGNTGNIKIGVVNEDSGSKIFSTKVTAGKTVIENLEDNDKFNWVFYENRADAIKDTENGNIYASIIIPADFSEKLCTLVDEQPQKPELQYFVNYKLNAIAPKMTDAGVNAIKNEITQSVVETAVEKVFTKLGEAVTDSEGNTIDLKRVQLALHALNDHMPVVNDRLDILQDDINEYITGIEQKQQDLNQLRETLNRSSDFANNVSNDLPKVSQRIKDLRKAEEELVNNITTLSRNTSNLLDELDDVGDDIASAGSQISSPLNDLQNSLKDLTQIQSGFGKGAAVEISKQVTEMTKPMGEMAALCATFAQTGDMASVSTFAAEFSTKAAKVQAAAVEMENLKTKVIALHQELDNAVQFAIAAAKSSPDNEKVPESAIRQLEKLQGTLDAYYQKSTELFIGLEALSTQLAADMQATGASLQDLQSGGSLDDVKGNALSVAKDIKAINNAFTEIMSQISDIDKQSSSALSTALSKFGKMLGSTKTLLDSVTSLPDNDKLNRTKRSLDNTLDSVKQLNGVILEDYDQRTDTVVSYIDDSAQLASDLSWSLDYLQRSTKNLDKLLDFAEEKGSWATEDLQKIKDRWPDAAEKVENLSNELDDIDEEIGLDRLVDMMNNPPEVEGDFFSEPVEVNTNELFPSENYGASLTPFYTTLCLWIGATILCAVLSTKSNNVPGLPPRHQYMGKYLEFILLGSLQGLLVALGNIFLLRVSMDQPLLFTMLCIFASIVFGTIIYTLVSLFSYIGKGLAIVLLVIQIGGSGGTFPIQVTPGFFQAIHTVIPFTFSVNAMREAMFGVNYGALQQDIFALGGYFVLFCCLGLLLQNICSKKLDPIWDGFHHSGMCEHG
ncbi:YhgE/Pip domain-containing protein [Oscillospiraceae bacterium MB08-C2-2]|nr:YhgE/Pip domain-containing protein [Oscillospiraceae bacterium MB08-C2-2]